MLNDKFIMSEQLKKHVIAILVDNEFGGLARIVDLFSARGYNIESLTVAPINSEKTMSRVTVTTFGTQKTVDLICKLLKKIVPVHQAADLSLDSEGYIERELALMQIIGDSKKHEEALKIAGKHRVNIVETKDESLVFEVIGSAADVDETIKKLENHGLASVSRTGIAAGFRGEKKLAEME
jgi:acetolactate synthase-1/3 small subunit